MSRWRLSADRTKPPSARIASTHCDFVAAPGGNDAAAGTAAAPFGTVQHLYNALQPGQTGCLRAGKYGDASAQYNFDKRCVLSGRRRCCIRQRLNALLMYM